MPRTTAIRGLSVWFPIAAALVPPAAAQVTRTEQTSGTTALLIAVSPVNERVVWVSGTQGTWLRTLDGGATWQSGRVSGADSLQFRDVHGVDANTAYLLSIGSGDQSRIYKTMDAGKTWTLQFTNTEPQGFYDCFDFWDARRGIVIGDAIDGKIAMLVTTDGGASWTRVPAEALPPAPA
ncbi:MAG: WD40/YVTN/BNR-like repeat-containing protein, partial [Pseudomonas sp.]